MHRNFPRRFEYQPRKICTFPTMGYSQGMRYVHHTFSGTARGPTMTKMIDLGSRALGIGAERRVRYKKGCVSLCEWHSSDAFAAGHREP